jgi:hypothetical protein
MNFQKKTTTTTTTTKINRNTNRNTNRVREVGKNSCYDATYNNIRDIDRVRLLTRRNFGDLRANGFFDNSVVIFENNHSVYEKS